MRKWPLNNENKHEEWKTILHIAKIKGFPYPIIWKLNTQVPQTLTLPPSYKYTPSNPQKMNHFHLLQPSD
jgi:hypothetical protein